MVNIRNFDFFESVFLQARIFDFSFLPSAILPGVEILCFILFCLTQVRAYLLSIASLSMMSLFWVSFLVSLEAPPVETDKMLWIMFWRFDSVIVGTVFLSVNYILFFWSDSNVRHIMDYCILAVVCVLFVGINRTSI